MLTFTEQITMCKSISGLSDATSVLNFKRDVNAGTARFLAKLSRPVERRSRFTDSVANQQYYQLPEDALRLSYIVYLTGTNIWVVLKQVGDEDTWRKMNSYVTTTAQPTHYFARGGDEFGIYPTPSTAVTNGIEMVYEPRHVLLTADDYTTGTISVTNTSTTITGTGTVFTPTMANGTYVLQVTDGTDGNFYPITGYSSATSLTIENYYQGLTNTTATYRIGQVSKIPDEYQETPVDYAMYRYFLEKTEMDKATQFNGLWQTSLKDAEATYGMTTSSQIIDDSNYNLGRTTNPLLDTYDNQINV